MTQFRPPVQLSAAARRTWNRHAKRIHGEGRWQWVDQDLLAVYCRTLELYEAISAEIETHGVLVRGRTARARVRNQALTPLAQCRADLIRLSKAIPLVDPKPNVEGIELDEFLQEWCNE